MDESVKAAMIKSSQTMAISPVVDNMTPTTPQAKGVRKAHSTDSMNSPRHPTLASLANDNSDLPYPGLTASHVSAHNSPYLATPPGRLSTHTRGMSFDGTRFFSRSQVNLASASSSSNLDLTAGSKLGKEKGALLTKNLSPTKFCSILTSTSSTVLDVEDLKKLRLLLRNESAA